MNTFTDNHVAQIIEYFGYQLTEAGDRNIVVAQLESVEALGQAYADRVIELLNQLASIQKDIYEATPFASRAFSSSPSSTAQHFRGDRIRIPTNQAKQLLQRLSALLNLPIRKSAFSSGQVRIVR